MGATAFGSNLERVVRELFGGVDSVPDRLHENLLSRIGQAVVIQVQDEELGVWSPNQGVWVLAPPLPDLLDVRGSTIKSIFGDGSL